MAEVRFLRTAIWSAIVISSTFSALVSSGPIKIDFNLCVPALYPDAIHPTSISQCCPPKPTKPIIDGPPSLSTPFLRVRKASQCTDAHYAEQLNKGYALMRALPNSDPRSLDQQRALHCAYCGGSFLASNSSGVPQGIDIHFNWLFYPWHRWYMYFHERILQKLLNDPTFSLNYWNWDNPYTVGDGSDSEDGACMKRGDNFPDLYNDPSSAAYDVNRSLAAKGLSRFRFPDFSFLSVIEPNTTEQTRLESNCNIMHQALVSGGTTQETFVGRSYVAGNPRDSDVAGAGSLEGTAHAAVHLWTAQVSGLDMANFEVASRDPVFFAHHSNMDRLWQVWKEIGSIVGQNREDYSEPEFLNAEFLFYDENKDLRRVTVADSLETTNLGYVYQRANDAAWLYRNAIRCSNLNFEESIARAERLSTPRRKEGYYHLLAGKPFVLVIDRPDNPNGDEEFLTIEGIQLDRSSVAGFDVYVGLLNPSDYTNPCRCAEYNGRFTNMPQELLLALLIEINDFRRRRRLLPPGPGGWPLLGSLHLGTLPHQSLHDLSRKATENARQGYGFPATSGCAEEVFYDCINVAWTSYGKYWRYVRKVCTLGPLTADNCVSGVSRARGYEAQRRNVLDVSECFGVISIDNMTQLMMNQVTASRLNISPP